MAAKNGLPHLVSPTDSKSAESNKTSEIKFVHEGFYVCTFTEDSFGYDV